MGIKGLWSEVRPICRQSHLSNFRGQRLAVDMYVWLHRGIIGCVKLSTSADADGLVELVEGSSECVTTENFVCISSKLLQFIANRVELMLKLGVHPVFVFDGASIPMKKGTEKERQANRAARLAEAVHILKKRSTSNSKARQEAAQLLEKSIDITTELAHTVIQLLQERGLECIVAPYEADAQLAYLCREGYVQGVISEDSDLIAYHCPCLIAKLDGHGNCEVLVAQDLPQCQSFRGLSYESFLVGCILSGCDYLPSLRHIGVKKAFRVVSQANSVPSIIHNLETKFGYSREELVEYESKLQQAFYCFAHHFVFDPIRKEVVNLTQLPAGIPLKTNLLGEPVPKEIAQKVCGECLYDPNTHALYKGTYQYCLKEYWNNVRGGQRSLKTFSGFHDMQTPKVILSLEQRSNSTTTLFSSPLQKICEASGFCAKAKNRMTVVRSKYFASSRWKVDDLEGESDEGEGTQTHTSTTATTAATVETSESAAGTTMTTSMEDGMDEASLEEERLPNNCFALRASLSDTNLTSIPESSTQKGLLNSHAITQQRSNGDPLNEIFNLSPTLSSQGIPLSLNKKCALDSGNSQSKEREKIDCPFGYLQCGRRHSIFEICFQGKNWSNDTTNSTEGEHNNNDNNIKKDITTESGEGGPYRKGDLSCSSLQERDSEKRLRELSPPSSLRRGFCPPASTGEVPIVFSSHGDCMAPAAKRRALSSTETALMLMSRFNNNGQKKTGVDVKAKDGNSANNCSSNVSSASGTPAAAEFFKKMAFSRR